MKDPPNPNCFAAEFENDTVWFILNDAYLIYTPPRAITYALAEAEHMARLSPSARRIVHEAKKHGARIVPPP